MIRYPSPLKRGDRIAVTAPSAGVSASCHARLDIVLAHLRETGFDVLEGACLREDHKHVSAPARLRAAELNALLLDPSVAAIFPPWGGELAIELLPRLDHRALASAELPWLVGYSDTSTLLMALTLQQRIATAHGPCLMDMAPGQDDPLTSALFTNLATPAGGSFVQRSSTHWQPDWGVFSHEPARTFSLSLPTRLAHLDVDPARPVRFSGRLIGGCLDTIHRLAGSPFGDVPRFVRDAGDEGVILYFENCNLRPTEFLCAIQGLKLAGWFDKLSGVLVGRSSAGDVRTPEWLNQREAIVTALGDLSCPVILGCDIGHMPPQWLLINGALAEVRYADGEARIEQRLA